MMKSENRKALLEGFSKSLDELEEIRANDPEFEKRMQLLRDALLPKKENTKNKMKISLHLQEEGSQEEFQKELNEFFKSVNSEEEFKKRMDQLEDMYTPKYEIYQQCREDFRSVYEAYISGALSKEKALLLLQSKYHRLQEEVYEIAYRGGFIIIDDVPEQYIEITMGIATYYKEMKYNIEFVDHSNTGEEKPQISIINTEQPKTESILPPVFQDVLKEGLLNNVPVNGKYAKRAGIKDMDVIKHVVDHSAYSDSLTADLYIHYIQVSIKPNSIDQYISRARQEAK